MASMDIKKISKKLRWKPKEVEYAIDEFLKSDTLLNRDKLLDICVQTQNPEDRLRESIKHFVSNYKGNPVELICNLLRYNDPCFRTISLFNIYDFYTGQEKISVPMGRGKKAEKIQEVRFKREFNYRLSFTSLHKSFINWDVQELIQEDEDDYILDKILEDEAKTLINIAHIPEKLRYKFLGVYLQYLDMTNELNQLFPEPTSYLNSLQPLLRGVVKEVGYLAFNLEPFRREVNYLSLRSNFKECRINLQSLNEAMFPTPKTKKEHTERRNWLWCAFMDKLGQMGKGQRPAARIARKVLGESTESAMTRNLSDMKKEARKRQLSLETIVKDYNLELELRELLEKANVVDVESLIDFDLDSQ